MCSVLFRGKYFDNGGKDLFCRKDIQDYVSSQWGNYNPLISDEPCEELREYLTQSGILRKRTRMYLQTSLHSTIKVLFMPFISFLIDRSIF